MNLVQGFFTAAEQSSCSRQQFSFLCHPPACNFHGDVTGLFRKKQCREKACNIVLTHSNVRVIETEVRMPIALKDLNMAAGHAKELELLDKMIAQRYQGA